MNGLKKAAIQYADNAEKVAGCGYEFQTEELTEAFIAGAQWQKQKDMQDESDIAVIAALDGAARGKKIMKEQMIECAVEGQVSYLANERSGAKEIRVELPLGTSLEFGEIVKVIILKNE